MYQDAKANFLSALELLANTKHYKELSAIHYKLANALLEQNEQNCEQKAI